MLKLSPRFFLSPRFLALPVIALAVIVALSQASNSTRSTNTEVAAPKILRAVNCANPANAHDSACSVARDVTTSVVR